MHWIQCVRTEKGKLANRLTDSAGFKSSTGNCCYTRTHQGHIHWSLHPPLLPLFAHFPIVPSSHSSIHLSISPSVHSFVHLCIHHHHFWLIALENYSDGQQTADSGHCPLLTCRLCSAAPGCSDGPLWVQASPLVVVILTSVIFRSTAAAELMSMMMVLMLLLLPSPPLLLMPSSFWS